MNTVLFNRVVELLLLPPGMSLLLLLGALLFWRVRRLALSLLVVALTTLYAASLPITAQWLIGSLEHRFPPIAADATQTRGAGAIVVLGAGRYPDAPEYGGDTVSSLELVRLRYAARLQRRTGLPLLVTGGSTMSQAIPEAQLMQRALREDLGIADSWTEERSHTTAENARFSAEVLAQKGVHRVFLVTHALHMPRAVAVFRRTGLEVVPAPTAFHRPHPMDRGITAWLPRIDALRRTDQALHEYIGMLWYDLRGL